jgi:hypothetical protein
LNFSQLSVKIFHVKQMISAKLKLKTEPDQFQALRAVSLAYRDGLNAVSRYAFEQGKTSSNQRLHQGRYAELRASPGSPRSATRG